MGNPDTRPQSEEFARRNNFRVELPDAQSLYNALDHAYQVEPDNSILVFKIGTSHSEDELFSQINVNAMVGNNAPHEGYSISTDFIYQNLNYQYWPMEQVEKLQRLLTDTYGYSSVDHQSEQGLHSLIIKDPYVELLYVLNLGVEDERTAWKRQVEAVDSARRDANHPYYELIKIAAEQALSHLVNNPHPTPMNSHVRIKPIDTDVNSIGAFDVFPLATFEVFKNRTERWAKFVEDAVNGMTKVKGIPQSGKLTLLPPSEIPQL